MALQSLVCFSSSGPAKDWPLSTQTTSPQRFHSQEGAPLHLTARSDEPQPRPDPHGLRCIRRHRTASLVLHQQRVGRSEPAILPLVEAPALRELVAPARTSPRPGRAAAGCASAPCRPPSPRSHPRLRAAAGSPRGAGSESSCSCSSRLCQPTKKYLTE